MDRHHVNIAPQGQASVNHAPAEPMREITENELDEYREQDVRVFYISIREKK